MRRIKGVAGLAIFAAFVSPLLDSLPASAADTIVLGAAISMTGKTAKEGEYTRDGYQFAVDTLNKAGGITIGGKPYKLQLKYYDDESKSERTAQLFEKLVNEDKVNFLLGPYASAPTATAAPIAEKYKIPMVEGNGSAESIFNKGYKYSFMVLSPAKLYLRGIIDVVRRKDPALKTVAILGENEPFSKEVASGAADYAKQLGMDVVYHELYPSNTQDVSSLLTNVKAKDLGVSPKAMGFSVGPSSPEFRANLKQDADYMFGATQWTSALKYNGEDVWKTPQAFAQAFKAKYPNYGDIPYQVAESAAAVIVYQKAIEKAGGLDPKKVRDAIAALDVMTFYGQIKFDSRGVNIYKPMAAEQLQPDGKKYTVGPPEVAEKEAIYPMPPWNQRASR